MFDQLTEPKRRFGSWFGRAILRFARAACICPSGLAADWNRCATSGRFSPRQRALYDLVLSTQQTAIDSVRPGTTLLSLNRIAQTYMRDHSADLCGSETCLPYFIHGL